jgi:transmembrane 9 superfamily protein 2/4
MRYRCVATLAALWQTAVGAFYISGWNPHYFPPGADVPLYYNKIFSDKSAATYAYSELPFVCPANEADRRVLNLGELLRGDRIVRSRMRTLLDS